MGDDVSEQPADEPASEPDQPNPEQTVLRERLSWLEEVLQPKVLRDLEHSVVDRVEQLVPAWRRQTQGERRTAVTIAVIAAIGLMLVLPQRVANHPKFLLPGVALLLLIGLVVANPGRLERQSKALRTVSLVLIAVMSIANAASGARLVIDLIRARGIRDPGELLGTGAAIWLTNIVVFALWYWDSDRGGPVQRAMGTKDRPDFLFPQMQSQEFVGPNWEPMFVDYLYLSFTNATAFSPTDVLPLSRWAKMVMMVQSLTSIVTVALVIARAVNVLK